MIQLYRYWKWAFGRYIIDDYDNIHDDEKLNGELMNVLAKIMMQVNYDNKQFMYVLFNTKLFQRELYDGAYSNTERFIFIGPVKQRLTAEQMWDSVVSIANEFRKLTHYVSFFISLVSSGVI